MWVGKKEHGIRDDRLLTGRDEASPGFSRVSPEDGVVLGLQLNFVFLEATPK